MFEQVLISPEQRSWQHVLWRAEALKLIEIFGFSGVTNFLILGAWFNKYYRLGAWISDRLGLKGSWIILKKIQSQKRWIKTLSWDESFTSRVAPTMLAIPDITFLRQLDQNNQMSYLHVVCRDSFTWLFCCLQNCILRMYLS